MTRMVWSVALIAAASSGCWVADATAPDLDFPAIRTDSAAYTLRRSDTGLQGAIGFTFTNRTGRDLFAGGCISPDPPHLERLVGDEWVVAYAPIVLLCWTPPRRIRDGESYRSALHISVPLAGTSGAPPWQSGLVPGTYRLVWDALSVPAPLPDELRTSNSFTLSLE
ncbi:MAG TPA: hypothetical protein VFQ38_15520 [Longimicrobiales bacterium]|nr:hypothetical protein [Longimicrobiales bacterium]